MTGTDAAFVDAVHAAARSAVGAMAGLRDVNVIPHRSLMDRAKLLAAAALSPAIAEGAGERLLDEATTLVGVLRERQGESGLFRGGDNVESPPDSAFTINDVCDTIELFRRVPIGGSAPQRLVDLLDEIADAAEPVLVSGGVHTPNHRWEISAALARLHRRRPSAPLRARIEEWLAEGIDIDADGMYSERSPNYAAHVSDPSLIAIADILQRPDLLDVVASNLDSTLGLILPDGSVETVHSRRQDQNASFSLAPYLMLYRRFAIERGRGDFAWAADRALSEGVSDAATVLADSILSPQITRTLPEPTPLNCPRTSLWPSSALVIDASPERTAVVYGGSDYPAFGRIRSGLANNPTFFRMFAGEVVIESVRLSRNFFGLGPFRAGHLDASPSSTGNSRYRLEESVAANYYQPVDPQHRRANGAYELADEGRFSAGMSFGRRARDTVRMETTITIEPTAEGATIDIDIGGPDVPWTLDFTFRDGGNFVGGEDLGHGDIHLKQGEARYRVGDSELTLGPVTFDSEGATPVYLPGEEYEYLSGTDAVSGRHAYVTGRSPGSFRMNLSCQVDAAHERAQ